MKDEKSDFISRYNKLFSPRTLMFMLAFAAAEAAAFFIICVGSFALMLAAYTSYKMGGLTYEGAKWVVDLAQMDLNALGNFAAGSLLSLLAYAWLGRMRKKPCF